MKLCVRNLSSDFNDQNLEKLFAEFGTVESASVMLDRKTGLPTGMAFVRMASSAEAEEAIFGLHGFRVMGCDLDVSELKHGPSENPIYANREPERLYSPKSFRREW